MFYTFLRLWQSVRVWHRRPSRALATWSWRWRRRRRASGRRRCVWNLTEVSVELCMICIYDGYCPCAYTLVYHDGNAPGITLSLVFICLPLLCVNVFSHVVFDFKSHWLNPNVLLKAIVRNTSNQGPVVWGYWEKPVWYVVDVIPNDLGLFFCCWQDSVTSGNYG